MHPIALIQRNVGEHDTCSLSRPRVGQRRRRAATSIPGFDARDADKDDATASGALHERSEFRNLRNQSGVGVERMKPKGSLVQEALRSWRGSDSNRRILSSAGPGLLQHPYSREATPRWGPL